MWNYNADHPMAVKTARKVKSAPRDSYLDRLGEREKQPLQAAGFRVLPVLRVPGPELCDAGMAACIRASSAVVSSFSA